jgi:F0F1-type ATP synthase membrane subunit b/b'
LKTNEAAAVLSPWFANLMNNLSNQVQIAVSEIAAVTLANERKRLLDEFRFQIQNEATGTIERVIATSKDELARRTLKVLNEGAQAIVKNSQESLAGAIERHIENAQQNLMTQRNELNQYLDTMATGTVERVQRNLETSRTKATERFVLRLREQVAPVMEEARADLQKLVASQTVFKEESQAIYRQVTDQLESDANARLLQTHDQLEKKSTSVVNECNEKMRELSQAFEKIARDSAENMIASATDEGNKNLEERAAEISSHFTDQLEGHVRSYLEFIGESIKEFPKKLPTA